MKIVMVLASIAPNAERTDGSISPTLMARAGTGGGQWPILILEDDNAGLVVEDADICIPSYRHLQENR